MASFERLAARDSLPIRAYAMTAGCQVGVHAIGDAGNRATLAFCDSVMQAAPFARAQRHRVAHAQVVAPSDVERFAALNVIASVQPQYAVEDKGWAEAQLDASRVQGPRKPSVGTRCGTRMPVLMTPTLAPSRLAIVRL